jgi:hypothetical protein
MLKRSAGARLCLLAALGASSFDPGACLANSPPSQDPVAAAAGNPIRAHRRESGNSLDDHIRILSKALDLDTLQQSQLRSVLESQRAEVAKIWSDTTVPAEYRISATRAISDQTADRIRALLTEEQQKKYNPHVKPHAMTPAAGERSVEEWMEATKAKPVAAEP